MSLEWTFPVTVSKVIDGDSIATVPNFPVSIRLFGVDTPETSDERQSAAALVCRLALAWWIDQVPRGQLYARTIKADKYGGRYDGDLVDATRPRPTAAEWMLANGYGRKYLGEKKPLWTDQELEAIVARGLPQQPSKDAANGHR